MRNALFLLNMCLLISCSDPQERIYPTKTRLTESVYASVTVQPDSLYQAYATVGGILDGNLVEEGQLVKKGTALVQVINNNPKLNMANALLNLQLAEENYQGVSAILGALEDEIKSAALSLKNDSVNYQRQKRLWDQNIGSKVQFERSKLTYEISRNNLMQLENKYGQTKNGLSTQLQQARNNYASSQITTKDFTVTSKINGKVYALFKNAGEIVNSMEPLAAVGSASEFIIEMLIDEVDIVKVVVGQKALIFLDAYGTELFEGKIRKIYPKKDERSQTFKVEATFDVPPRTLYPGLSGEGNIIIAEKENILTIPKDFLMPGSKVMTVDGPVVVVMGLQNLERVEILDGITESTEIVKPKE